MLQPVWVPCLTSLIDNSIIGFCHRGQPWDLQNVLIEVGHAERWLSKSSIRDNVPPLNKLSWEWLRHAKDNTPEFRLARSLASILQGTDEDGQMKVGAVRENFEPVTTRGRAEWDDANRSFVWTAGDPLSNLAAVLTRRCLDGRRKSLNHPPLDSQYSPLLVDIVHFLNGNVDVQRVVDLALPLSFIPYRRRRSDSESDWNSQPNAPFDLPTAYAAIKLTLLPGEFKCPDFGIDCDIWPEPRILTLLHAGRVWEAYRVAFRRLKASGLQPLSEDPGIGDGLNKGRLLAASLLIPLDKTANKALAKCALRKPETESELVR